MRDGTDSSGIGCPPGSAASRPPFGAWIDVPILRRAELRFPLATLFLPFGSISRNPYFRGLPSWLEAALYVFMRVITLVVAIGFGLVAALVFRDVLKTLLG